MSKNIEQIMKKFTSLYTPEYMEQLSKQCYKDDREYPENFSNWYYNIQDFGKFKHPEIISHQIFTYEELKILQKWENIKDVDWTQYIQVLKPTLEKLDGYKIYNIKNGCFSNKFEFNTCITNKFNLAENFWKIQYSSACFETGGETELVVREYIPYNKDNTVVIYNGMPLRTEVRVFYNMLTKQIEYVTDYWDYKYCIDNLHSLTDKVCFNYFHNKVIQSSDNVLQAIKHQIELEDVIRYINMNIHTLKFNDKLGQIYPIWSIDFMYDNTNDSVYLIDMARGFRSAYWNPQKLNKDTLQMLKTRKENN